MKTKEQRAIENRRFYATHGRLTREDYNAYLAAIESRRLGWTREAYAEFLQSFCWEDMITVTFREPRKEPYYAAKNVWRVLFNGQNSAGHYNCVSRAFLAVEPFQSGDLHIHGLIAGNVRGVKPEMALPWEIYDSLFTRFGRTRVEACNSMEAVTNYCAKYILKQQSRVCDFYYLFGDKYSWENGILSQN